MITLKVGNFTDLPTYKTPVKWSASINDTIIMDTPISINEGWSVEIPTTPLAIKFHWLREDEIEIFYDSYSGVILENGKTYFYDWFNETFTVESGDGDGSGLETSSLKWVLLGTGVLGLWLFLKKK